MMFLLLLFVLFSVASATISPVVKCTVRTGSVCGARWGYDNGGELAFIPYGERNNFSPSASFKPLGAHPIRFEPGRHELLFQTVWNCELGPLRWTIDDGSGPRSATALHFNTCDCGTGCLEGLHIDSILAERSIRYVMTGGSCEISHFVLELAGCEPSNGERAAGPCAPDYPHPYKIDGAGGNLSFDSLISFALDEITIKGGTSCSACETLVPVCQTDPSTSSLRAATTTISSSSSSVSVIESSELASWTTLEATTSKSSTAPEATTSSRSPELSSSTTSSEATTTTKSLQPTYETPEPTRKASPPPKPPRGRRKSPTPVTPPVGREGEKDDNPPKRPEPALTGGTPIDRNGWIFIGIGIGLGFIALVCTAFMLLYATHRRRKTD